MEVTDGPSAGAREVSTPVVLLAGLCALAVAVGISRFAYTPILPVMQAALGLDHASAGWLASMNYLGYLVGALAGGLVPRGARGDLVLRTSLLVVAAGTLLMASPLGMIGWSALRLLAGIASGVVFVMAADRVMRVVGARGQDQLVGAHFSGVGVGIVLSGLLAAPLAAFGGWQAQWAGLGIVSLALMLLPWFGLSTARLPAVRAVASTSTVGAARAFTLSVPLWALVVAYTLDGFGYIISGTFMVAMVEGVGGLQLGATLWVFVGIAGIAACLASTVLARRFGYVQTLIAAHVLQVLGVMLPVTTTVAPLLILGACLFGATFMAITTLSLAIGRQVAGDRAALAIGGLTAGYGVGQVLGPLAAGPLADASGSFMSSAALAAGALVVATTLLLATLRRSSR